MSRIADALEKAGLSRGSVETFQPKLTLESFRASHGTLESPVVAETSPAAVSRPSTAPAKTAATHPVAGRKVRLRVPEVWPDSTSACVANERLVTSPHLGPVAGHQYRKLASTLHQLQTERGLRSVLVTSAVSGEGKSITAANLALTLSESFCRRVLLIDGDLRRPTLDTLFGATTNEGLSVMLALENEPVAPLIPVSKNLSLLAAGHPDPDPVGAFTSDRMRHLLEDASKHFDWIIIDSAPIGLFPDPELLSMLVDGVVIVVRAETTSYVQIQKAIATLTPERIIGAVLNDVEKTTLAKTDYYPKKDRQQSLTKDDLDASLTFRDLGA